MMVFFIHFSCFLRTKGFFCLRCITQLSQHDQALLHSEEEKKHLKTSHGMWYYHDEMLVHRSVGDVQQACRYHFVWLQY